MPISPRVEILLAVRNNSRYLEEMLNSLKAQTYTDFHIIASDDASEDDSLNKLKSASNDFRHPMRIIERTTPSGSAMANFKSLMKLSDADIVLWADADDIWLPEKVERVVEELELQESQTGKNLPTYIFSDAYVIDSTSQFINESYWKFKKIDPSLSQSLSHLLICPPMLGCTSAANRALIEMARDVPLESVTGHDWWAILVANVFGKISHIQEPLIKYRIHDKNSSSPRKATPLAYLHLGPPVHEVRRRIEIRRKQASAITAVFGSQVPPEKRDIIEKLILTRKQDFAQRRINLFRNKLLYPDVTRNLALLFFS